jgi:hypothetical protein
MKITYLPFLFVLVACSVSAWSDDSSASPPSSSAPASGTLVLDDNFDREESDPALEEVGNGWSTNSRARAKGVKQVDLEGGALHIKRAEVADHGVSVVHDMQFQDGIIQLRFKLGAKDDLGINIADLQEKSVHAGHLCMAKVQLHQVELIDMKTGRMNLQARERRLAGEETAVDKKKLSEKSKFVKVDLSQDQWNELEVKIVGDVIAVKINGQEIGEFQSEGIAHPTKRTLRLAVGKAAWVDDVKVWRLK